MSANPPAELIIDNVQVITMDPLLPSANGIAIAKGKIVGVLHSGQKNWPLAPGGRKIDGGGMFILPGLIDAHCHLRAVLSRRLSVSSGKDDVASVSELIGKIRAHANQLPAGQWVRAGGYNPFYLEENRHPTRHELDFAAPNHPVRLRHVTRHISVLNSFALRLAGISRNSHSPPGMTVERDPHTNEPTGVIYGGDKWLSECIVPPYEPEQWQAGTKQLETFLLSRGITALIDATPTTSIADLKHWLAQMNNGWPITIQFMAEDHNHDMLCRFLTDEIPVHIRGRMQAGAVKVVMEANPELHPSLDELKEIASKAAKKDASLAIHVVDPEMIWTALEAVRNSKEKYPRNRSICRFEHLSLCPDAFLDDLKALDITAVTNPCFIREHGDRYLAEVDPDEYDWLYPMKSLLDKGIRLAAGSDAPVASFSPWAGISAAIDRNTLSGKTIGHDEKLSRYQALNMYTVSAAQSAGWEDCRGMLRPGFQADFIILKESPLHCPAEKLEQMNVHQTWIEGNLVYQAR